LTSTERNATGASPPSPARRDAGLFLCGQAVSRLGSSFTAFALPLLVFSRTGSPRDLGIAMAATVAPYLLFGLVLGAWVDRHDRKRLMVASDLGRAALVATIRWPPRSTR